MNWTAIVEQFLDPDLQVSEPLREVLQQVRGVGPAEITRAMDPEASDAVKVESTRFLLQAIGQALDDHVLTDEEVRDITTLRRVFRIEEGDLVSHHAGIVSDLLCREAELIFEDRGISPAEAVHKARLQEVFGLGYDDFITVIEPEIDRLMEAQFERLDNGTPETWLGSDWQEVRDRLAALSLVRHVQALREPDPSRAGYIYLLVNPSMPGMVKVGRTSHPPRKRAAELAGTTGVPTPFTVVFDLFVADQFAAETYVHDRLAENSGRVSDNREFFAVEPSDAIRVMLEAGESS